PRVLFVGRLVAKKGVDVAVHAARAAGGAFELAVAGPGTLAPAPHVEALGALPRERVAELYRAADAFLLPSRGEGFPLTIQEAMASGLPAFVLDDPGYHRSTLAPHLQFVPSDAARIAQQIVAALGRPRPSNALTLV